MHLPSIHSLLAGIEEAPPSLLGGGALEWRSGTAASGIPVAWQQQQQTLEATIRKQSPITGSPPGSSGSSSGGGGGGGGGGAQRRKYVCQEPGCHKSFTTSGHLARHFRIHTGEKNYPCAYPGCSSRFSRQDNMMQHYRTHSASLTKRRLKRTPDTTSPPQIMLPLYPAQSSSNLQSSGHARTTPPMSPRQLREMNVRMQTNAALYGTAFGPGWPSVTTATATGGYCGPGQLTLLPAMKSSWQHPPPQPVALQLQHRQLPLPFAGAARRDTASSLALTPPQLPRII